MRWNPRGRRARLPIALAAGLVGVSTLAVSVGAGAATSQDDWPMFMQNPRHTGKSTSVGLSTTTAPSLGLKWMSNTGQPTYTSPVVAFSKTLGTQLLFAGSRNGTMAAYDATNGERVWWFRSGAGVTSTPAVFRDVVYWGGQDYKVRAFNMHTGALLCEFDTGGAVSASPTVVNVPGQGVTVYVGDNGTGGSADGGHVWALRGFDPADGAANDCTEIWRYDQFGEPAGSQPLAGSWSPAAYGVDRNGRNLVVVGSSNPDNSIYALDAKTGARIWRHQSWFDFQDADIGAGITLTNPGVNGQADGVAYGIGKAGIMYALNLTTGAVLWQFDTDVAAPGNDGAERSTPAVLGQRLYYGYGDGVLALNALTGAELWRFETDTKADVMSSPAIAGPDRSEVVIVGSVEYPGKVYALNARTGAKLWSYTVGSFIWGSAAVSADTVYITSDDGFIYAFGLGVVASERPSVTIVSPTAGSTIPNSGTLAINGTASDDVGVTKVKVAVRQINTNSWWDVTTDPTKPRWNKVFVQNEATLTNPGAASTNWTFQLPVPLSGGPFVIQAAAMDADSQYTAPVALENISVANAAGAPDTRVTSPVRKDVFNLPMPPASFNINVTGTASDAGGTNVGVKAVKVVVRNVEHGEYYCGGPCGGHENHEWSTQYHVVDALLASPGAANTTWTLSFPTYDHEHNYRITAWAVDRDNLVDASKANVSPVCVRMPPDRSCN